MEQTQRAKKLRNFENMDNSSFESHYYLFSRVNPVIDERFQIKLLGDLVCTPEYYKHHHSHDAIEFCLITEGHGSFFIADMEYKVEAGDIFLTHPDQVHRSKADPFAPYRMYYMVFNVSDDPRFRTMYDQLAKMEKHLVKDQYNLAHFFSLLVAEFIMKEEGANTAVSSLFHTILVYLYRNFLVNVRSVNRQISSRQKIIQRVVAIVEQNCETKLDLNSIASEIGYSPSYLSRIFKEQMGINLSLYWNRVRMAHARRYIHDYPDKSLPEISVMVGIEDYHYFSRVFKSIYGESPRAAKLKTK